MQLIQLRTRCKGETRSVRYHAMLGNLFIVPSHHYYLEWTILIILLIIK